MSNSNKLAQEKSHWSREHPRALAHPSYGASMLKGVGCRSYASSKSGADKVVGEITGRRRKARGAQLKADIAEENGH